MLASLNTILSQQSITQRLFFDMRCLSLDLRSVSQKLQLEYCDVSAMSQLTPEQRAIVLYSHKQGRSLQSIASEIGCGKTTVHNCVISSSQGRGLERKPRDVQKRLLDDIAAKRAVQLLKSNQAGGARFAAAQLHREGYVARTPSRQTVVRAAKRAAREAHDPLEYTRSLPKKGLTQATRKKRLQFCRANANRDWNKVMFTDRCKFHYRFPGSKVWQGRWVNKSEKHSQRVYTPSHPQCYNAYGGITVHGTTKLVPVAGTDGVTTRFHNKKGDRARNITAEEYKEVVCEHVLPSGEGLFSPQGVRDWVLQQDRDPAHTVAQTAVAEYNALGLSHVEVLPDWPGNSPDLNPIENVWGIILDRVQRKGCSNFSEFKRRVNREFEQIDRATVQHIFKSMPERIRMCLARGGDKIDY